MKKYILITIGSVSVAAGFIGIFLPLLPTTPFLLLAAACYIRSSSKLYSWLIEHKIFGKYIKDYLDGKGIPLKAKIFSITLLWAMMLYSGIFIVKILIIRIIMFIIAVCVTWHILSLKTRI